MSEKSNNRKKFGKRGKPLVGTKAWRKPLKHFDDAYAWVVANGDDEYFTFNTYKGNLGGKSDPKSVSGEVKKSTLKNYEESSIAECPVAVTKEEFDAAEAETESTAEEAAVEEESTAEA